MTDYFKRVQEIDEKGIKDLSSNNKNDSLDKFLETVKKEEDKLKSALSEFDNDEKVSNNLNSDNSLNSDWLEKLENIERALEEQKSDSPKRR